jgi:hypothetical protein
MAEKGIGQEAGEKIGSLFSLSFLVIIFRVCAVCFHEIFTVLFFLFVVAPILQPLSNRRRAQINRRKRRKK